MKEDTREQRKKKIFSFAKKRETQEEEIKAK